MIDEAAVASSHRRFSFASKKLIASARQSLAHELIAGAPAQELSAAKRNRQQRDTGVQNHCDIVNVWAFEIALASEV